MRRLALLLLACSLLSFDHSSTCHAQTKYGTTNSTLKYLGVKQNPNQNSTLNLGSKFTPRPTIYRTPTWWRPTHLPSLQLYRGIDPAAHTIQFRILNKTSQFRGRVEISAVVKNVGSATYKSRAGAQAAYLYQGNRVVAQRDFTELRPGQELKLTHTRNWDSSSPAEGEFPPDYKLIILYDPDIAIDGNSQNDDVNRSNNQKTRNSMEINRMFR